MDIGASSKEEVEERGLHVGCPIIWNPRTERMGNKVFGKAMDDRFTYPVMLGLAESIQGKDLSCDLYLASTIQEETGFRGAHNLAPLLDTLARSARENGQGAKLAVVVLLYHTVDQVLV